MLRVDFHTHSLASGHALNTVEELLRHADRLGIEALAVTDHAPGTDNTILLAKDGNSDNLWKKRIQGADIHYFNVFLTRYQPPPDVKTRLYKGIECNIFSQGPHLIDLPPKLIDKFDVVIASLHPLPHVFDIKNEQQVTERLLQTMDEPIDIIGHPFQNLSTWDIALIVKSAAEKDIVLELNDDSIRQKKTSESSMLEMLQLAKKYDCRISLSSDTHAANELGSDNSIQKVLTATQFPQQLIVNHSLESASRFVEERKMIRAQKRAKIEKNNET